MPPQTRRRRGCPAHPRAGILQETLAGAGAPDLSELKAMIAGKTGRAWGELPGHLRTEILQMSQGRYRDDYARLIQLYFREIAAGAGAGGEDPDERPPRSSPPRQRR